MLAGLEALPVGLRDLTDSCALLCSQQQHVARTHSPPKGRARQALVTPQPPAGEVDTPCHDSSLCI